MIGENTMGNNMEFLIKNIESTLNYKLSLSNLELYHSNLLEDILTRNIKQPFLLLQDVVDKYEHYQIIKVEREKGHKDITVTLKKNEETIVVIIENKFKSLPDREQLEKYIENKDNTYYVLLSLVEPEDNVLPPGWVRKSYLDLAEYINSIIKITNIDFYKGFLEDYSLYIKSISKLISCNELDLKVENYYLDKTISEKLSKMGLIDLVSNLRAQQMKNKVKINGTTTYANRVRGGWHFGCEYLINEQLSVEIQLEGKQYRQKINCKKTIGKSLEGLIESCVDLKNRGVLFDFDKAEFLRLRDEVVWNKYETNDRIDIYYYQTINNNVAFNFLLAYIKKDMKNIISNADLIKEIIFTK
jgi:hypothetical protein